MKLPENIINELCGNESIMSEFTMRELIEKELIKNEYLVNLYKSCKTSLAVSEQIQRDKENMGVGELEFTKRKGFARYLYKKILEEADINSILIPKNNFTKRLKQIKGYENRRDYFKDFLSSCSSLSEVLEKAGLGEESYSVLHQYGIIYKVDILKWNFNNGKESMTPNRNKVRSLLNKNILFNNNFLDSDLSFFYKKYIQNEVDVDYYTFVEIVKKEHPNRVILENGKLLLKNSCVIVDAFNLFQKKKMHYDASARISIEDIINEFVKYSNLINKNSVKELIRNTFIMKNGKRKEYLNLAWNEGSLDASLDSNDSNMCFVRKYLRLYDNRLVKYKYEEHKPVNPPIIVEEKEIVKEEKEEEEKNIHDDSVNNEENGKTFIEPSLNYEKIGKLFVELLTNDKFKEIIKELEGTI